MLRGLSAIPGVPLDVAGRMSLGNLIPATGVFLKSKPDKAQEIARALGPIGGLAQSATKALKGDALGLAPVAIQNLGKAIEMHRTGMYKDAKGERVMDTGGLDAAMKGIGFQPAKIARESRQVGIEVQQRELARATQSEITRAWAQGIFEADPDRVADAQRQLRNWNRDNPESRITVDRPAIVGEVRNIAMSRVQRFIKASPKAMRPSVIAGLQ